jgi:ferredoxin
MPDQPEGIDSKRSKDPEPASASDRESALPPLDSLDEKSDFSVFLSPGVSEEQCKSALRKLFHSQILAQRDGLDDYDDDYRSFKPIGDTVTAHARHQMERLAKNSGDPDPDEANRIEGESPLLLAKTAQSEEEGIEISETQKNRSPREQRTAGPEPSPSPPNSLSQSSDQHARDMGRSDSPITFRSRGHLVVIGEQDRAPAVAAQLADRLPCTLIVHSLTKGENSDSRKKLQDPENVRMLQGTAVEVTGYLGMFEVAFCDPGGGAHSEPRRLEHCDLVLDLTTPPHLRDELLPPGYYAPGEDPQALQKALEELPDLVGEFEKPRFVNYDLRRCAHGNARARGCSRCIEVCPAGAISPGQSSMEINHHLCQGCLICATACPTAAITETSPETRERVQQLAADLQHHRTNQAAPPCVLFHDGDMDGAELTCLQSGPLPVVSLRLEQIGSIGMDIWFALLAGGASQVILWSQTATPSSVLRELELQRSYAATILEGMGYEPQRLHLIVGDNTGKQMNEILKRQELEPGIMPAFFTDLLGKRGLIRQAVQHLYQQMGSPQSLVTLPEGAPFGGIDIDPRRCTLCLACANVCPVSAISSGSTGNQLRFFEEECVQCGLCRQSCPEQAIRLIPRLRYQAPAQGHVLHEEQPFNCICCGAPFSTRRMVDRVTEKLTGHWMFEDDTAKRRLQMCRDCRLQDIFSREESIQVHR